MNKAIPALALLFILLLAVNASAKVIKETSFNGSGYQDFLIEEKDSFLCQEIIFPQDLQYNSSEYYHFLSVHAQFLPIDIGRAQVQVIFGEDINKFFSTKDFKNGWVRILLPREKLQEKNSVTICGKASDSIAQVKILNDSKTGTYLSPELILEKTPETFFPLTGEEIKIKVELTNKGSEQAFVSLRHKKEIVEYDQIEVIRGKTFFDGLIEAGETIALDYSIKTVKTTELQLPAAIASYTNVFGEQETILSDYPVIYILSNEQSIRPVILVDNALAKTGEKVEATLAVKNNSITSFQNLVTKLELPEGLSLQGEKQFVIDSLSPGETKYFKFAVLSNQPGKFDLGCVSTYLQKEITQQQCPTSSLTIESTQPNYPIIIGVGLLLAGIAIYALMYFKG